MSVYNDMVEAGIETDHHESDLYVPDTPKAREILASHGLHVDGWNVQPFLSLGKNRSHAEAWLDIPFSYPVTHKG